MSGQIYGLAVDDTQSARLVMSRTLFQAGCTPITACDGHSGWLLAESLLPRIVITDLDMTPWGGLRMIQAIRTSDNPIVRETPIIVCSATNDSKAKHASLQATGVRFLAKPINIIELRDLIYQALIEKSHPPKSISNLF